MKIATLAGVTGPAQREGLGAPLLRYNEWQTQNKKGMIMEVSVKTSGTSLRLPEVMGWSEENFEWIAEEGEDEF